MILSRNPRRRLTALRQALAADLVIDVLFFGWEMIHVLRRAARMMRRGRDVTNFGRKQEMVVRRGAWLMYRPLPP